MLEVGRLGLLGLTLADQLQADDFQKSNLRTAMQTTPTSCIFIFLEGGPSQLETFDPKPNAIENVRGPYGNIATSVREIQIGNLLPMLAERMDRYAVIRQHRQEFANLNS